MSSLSSAKRDEIAMMIKRVYCIFVVTIVITKPFAGACLDYTGWRIPFDSDIAMYSLTTDVGFLKRCIRRSIWTFVRVGCLCLHNGPDDIVDVVVIVVLVCLWHECLPK